MIKIKMPCRNQWKIINIENKIHKFLYFTMSYSTLFNLNLFKFKNLPIKLETEKKFIRVRLSQ